MEAHPSKHHRRCHRRNYHRAVDLDTIAPTISAFSVTPASIGPTESFSISKTAADNTNGTGVKTIQIYRAAFSSIPDQNGNKCDDTNKNACAWQDLGNITSDNPNPGTYYYGIHVTDKAENCITESTGADGKGGHCNGANDGLVRTNFGLIKVTKVADNTPPTISGGSPTGYITTKTPTISVATDENATCKYAYSDVAYASMTAFTTTGAKSHSATAPDQGEGSKTVFVACKDSLNNTNTANTTPPRISFSYTVDTIAPSVSWKIGIDNTSGTNYTRTISGATTNTADMSLKQVQVNDSTTSTGSTTDNGPTITIQYSDNSGGSGIADGLAKPQINGQQCVAGTIFESCSTPTNTSFSFKIKMVTNQDNNGEWTIPLSFIKDKAGNPAVGSITVTIKNLAPNIR